MITINGKCENISEINLSEYLKKNEYNAKHVVIELNGEILPNNCYDNIVLKDNDVVEILMFMGGGC